jgi:hypothetical protein
MKKSVKVFSLLLVVISAISFAGCGSSLSKSASGSAAYDAAEFESVSTEEAAVSYDSGFVSYSNSYSDSSAEDADTSAQSSDDISDMSEKIIYSAEMQLETTEFDSALEEIQSLVSSIGGFLESTSVYGNSYTSIARGYTGERSATYVIRVPSDKFASFSSSLSEIGNIPYTYTSMENITMQYYDTQSRLEAYRTQETRLLEMLSAAESVDDMLAIQQQLTEVQYEIDTLSGKLRYYDHQVNYSTVTLQISEVREYTPEPTITLTYWQRMGRGFSESLKSVGEFFKDFFLWFVTSLPWLVPTGVGIAAVVVLVYRSVRRHPERQARREARKAARAAKREAKRSGKNTSVVAVSVESDEMEKEENK